MNPVQIVSKETWEADIRGEVQYVTSRSLRILNDMKTKRLRDPIVDQALLDTVIRNLNQLHRYVEIE